MISKGTAPDQDGYSAFEGTDAQGKPLKAVLTDLGIQKIYIGGLATDYCVKASCLDAVKNNFETYLLQDASRAVSPEETKNVIKEITAKGIKLINLQDLG